MTDSLRRSTAKVSWNGPGLSVKAVAFGFSTACLILFVVLLFNVSNSKYVLYFVLPFVSVLLGGFVAGKLAADNKLLNGLTVGILWVLMSFYFNNNSLSISVSWYSLGALSSYILMLVGGLLGAFFARGR